MNPVTRFAIELAQLRSCLDVRDFRRYLHCIFRASIPIIKQKTLAPADALMDGNVSVTVEGKRIVLPLGAIKSAIFPQDPTPTFGQTREMYASNVYLRAFAKGLKAETVIDLGSNRGLFLMLASEVLDGQLMIGVEPLEFYDGAFTALIEAN